MVKDIFPHGLRKHETADAIRSRYFDAAVQAMKTEFACKLRFVERGPISKRGWFEATNEFGFGQTWSVAFGRNTSGCLAASHVLLTIADAQEPRDYGSVAPIHKALLCRQFIRRVESAARREFSRDPPVGRGV